MQEKLSAKTTAWPLRVRLLMLALNFTPLLHVLLIIWIGWEHSWVWSIVCLYLLPPLAVRLLLALRSIRSGSHAIGSHDFILWWATAQAQMIFCRLPILEEVLRLVPGCYSAWLRLWGAKIGRLTFWAPGLRILDRSLLNIGADVVIGTGVRLSAHVMATDQSGQTVLHVGPIVIGDRSRIGGYALLTAGTIIEDDADVHACALFPPFTTWKNGRRTKPVRTP